MNEPEAVVQLGKRMQYAGSIQWDYMAIKTRTSGHRSPLGLEPGLGIRNTEHSGESSPTVDDFKTTSWDLTQ